MATNEFGFITKHYDTDGLVYFVTKSIRIYSVGVWNKGRKEFYTLPFIRIYSVGVWNSPSMVGDNRNHSFDSRFFGAVPYKFLVGKVRWQLFWHDLEKRLDQRLKWSKLSDQWNLKKVMIIFINHN